MIGAGATAVIKTTMQTPQVTKLDQLLLGVSFKRVLRLFLFYYLPILTLIVIAVLTAHRLEREQSLRVRLAQEEQRIHLAKSLLVNDLEILASDLFLLAHSRELAEFIATGRKDVRRRRALQRRFLSFARDRRLYDQIRYIDETGHEVVRVNFDGGQALLVPQAELQDKRNRYYFKETSALPAGGLFVSPLDLNVEHGEIEAGPKPVLRAATPIHDAGGAQRGVVVINYLAERMLNRMWAPLPENQGSVYQLVNLDGYWLRHPDANLEWGFMYHQEQRIGASYPAAWRKISSGDAGQFTGAEGVFTYLRVDPRKEMLRLNENLSDAASAPQSAVGWILIGHIPRDQLAPGIIAWITPLRALGLAMLLVLAAIVSWYLARAKANKQQWEYLTNLLFLAVDQSPTAVILTDQEGRIEYVNDRFCELSGYPIEEVIGTNPRVLKSGKTSSQEYGELWEAITNGQSWSGEFHNRRRDGSYYWAEAHIAPVMDAGGSIKHFIGIEEDVTEKRQLQRQLQQMAQTDPLTGSYNRNYLLQQVEAEIKRSHRHGHTFSLLMLDIDHFKSVNDRWGHPTGDQVLRAIVARVREKIRDSDLLARFGGEEFVILLPETELDQAAQFAERIRADLEKQSTRVGDERIGVTVSVGCAQWHSDETGFDQLLARVDSALYRAKELGRNRVYAA